MDFLYRNLQTENLDCLEGSFPERDNKVYKI